MLSEESLRNANAKGSFPQSYNEKLYINCDILLTSQAWEALSTAAWSIWQLPLIRVAYFNESNSSDIYCCLLGVRHCSRCGRRLRSINKYLRSTHSVGGTQQRGWEPGLVCMALKTAWWAPGSALQKATWRRRLQAKSQGEGGRREGQEGITGKEREGMGLHRTSRASQSQIGSAADPESTANLQECSPKQLGSLDGRHWGISHTGWTVLSHCQLPKV